MCDHSACLFALCLSPVVVVVVIVVNVNVTGASVWVSAACHDAHVKLSTPLKVMYNRENIAHRCLILFFVILISAH